MEMRETIVLRDHVMEKELLVVEELTNQAWKRQLRVGGDRSTKLVPPTLAA